MSRSISQRFRKEIQHVQNQIQHCREQAEFYRGLEVRTRRRGSNRNSELARGLLNSFNEEIRERQQQLQRLQDLQADFLAGAAEGDGS